MLLRQWIRSWSSRGTGGNFVDLLRVRVRAGRGGGGAVSFDRSAQYPKGRPSGGDGGSGGNVVVVTDAALSSLNHIPRLVAAKEGGAGGNNHRRGAVGTDTVIRVPPGTELYRVIEDGAGVSIADNVEYCDGFVLVEDVDGLKADETTMEADAEIEVDAEIEMDAEIEVDAEIEMDAEIRAAKDAGPHGEFSDRHIEPLQLTIAPGERVVVAQGGRGGRGNYAVGRNNHEREEGERGEECLLEINLKTMADVGLVGLPNAGKSSFLAAVSGAHPRIAPYPFTTLNPYVGIIEYADGGAISVADIPGLIAGAHADRGLGHQFLKHIVKSRMLALVVDFAHAQPQDDINTLLAELDLFQAELSHRCRLVIANKADLLDGPTLLARVEACRRLFPRLEFWPISALHSLAITRVTGRLRELLLTALAEEDGPMLNE